MGNELKVTGGKKKKATLYFCDSRAFRLAQKLPCKGGRVMCSSELCGVESESVFVLVKYLADRPFSLHIIRVGRLPFLSEFREEKRSSTMLETYFMDEKKIASYQRGPLGPYFDGLAGYLAEKGYKKRSVWRVLQRCRHFSAFLGNREIFTFESINRSLVERFLSIYIPGLKGSGHYKRRAEIDTKCDLNHLFAHLAETGVLNPKVQNRLSLGIAG